MRAKLFISDIVYVIMLDDLHATLVSLCGVNNQSIDETWPFYEKIEAAQSIRAFFTEKFEL